MECNLSMERMLCVRFIKLIELGSHGKLNWLQAARTRLSHFRRQPTANTNLERLALGGEVDLNLGQNLNFRGIKAKLRLRDLSFQSQWPQLQLPDIDAHKDT